MHIFLSGQMKGNLNVFGEECGCTTICADTRIVEARIHPDNIEEYDRIIKAANKGVMDNIDIVVPFDEVINGYLEYIKSLHIKRENDKSLEYVKNLIIKSNEKYKK